MQYLKNSIPYTKQPFIRRTGSPQRGSNRKWKPNRKRFPFYIDYCTPIYSSNANVSFYFLWLDYFTFQPTHHITTHHSHSAGRWMNITCVSTAPFNREYVGINSKYGSLHITFCMEFHRLIMHCIDTLNCNIEITSSHSNKLFLVKIALIRPLELLMWNIQ